MTTGSNYAAEAYVTAANPAPGVDHIYEYPVRSGSGWDVAYTTRSDGGIGLNTYIAGGTGPGGAVPVTFGSGTISISASLAPSPSSSVQTSIPYSTATQVAASYNPTRSGFYVFNNSDVSMYIQLGPSASANLFTIKLYSNGFYEAAYPVFNGVISLAWDAGGSGNAQITEVT